MPPQAIRVLYIDDDPGIRRLVQRRLQANGIQVALAAGAEEALGAAPMGAEHFDAVALDHYMPGRDGLDMLAELRAGEDAPPVIFVTAAEEPRIAIAALKEGAEDYVLKDVQGAFLDLLGPTLLQAVERARMRREKEAAEREVRESRDRLERLAAQQEILLREVNHRVANSLQLISSLIELQARRVGEDGAREMLKQAAQRVEAVALVHRRLYTSQNVEVVDMDQYLVGMIDEFRRAVATDGEGRAIELSAEPVRIPNRHRRLDRPHRQRARHQFAEIRISRRHGWRGPRRAAPDRRGFRQSRRGGRWRRIAQIGAEPGAPAWGE